MNLRRIALSTFFTLLSLILRAEQVAPAEGLRSSGKIYVVVGVILIILAGLVIYLITLDRKIKRLERRINPCDLR